MAVIVTQHQPALRSPHPHHLHWRRGPTVGVLDDAKGASTSSSGTCFTLQPVPTVLVPLACNRAVGQLAGHARWKRALPAAVPDRQRRKDRRINVAGHASVSPKAQDL